MNNVSLRVTVWGENLHEQDKATVQTHYPRGMHATIAEGIRGQLGARADVRTATFDQPQHGLTEEVLAATDVLTWWGHVAHDHVDDVVVERVHERVLLGMGLIVLHSGHHSKIFKPLMGTTCSLRWRDRRARAGMEHCARTPNCARAARRSSQSPSRRCTVNSSTSRRRTS